MLIETKSGDLELLICKVMLSIIIESITKVQDTLEEITEKAAKSGFSKQSFNALESILKAINSCLRIVYLLDLYPQTMVQEFRFLRVLENFSDSSPQQLILILFRSAMTLMDSNGTILPHLSKSLHESETFLRLFQNASHHIRGREKFVKILVSLARLAPLFFVNEMDSSTAVTLLRALPLDPNQNTPWQFKRDTISCAME